MGSELEEQRSDGQDGVEGQSFGEHDSDAIHHQQEEVELCFFCTEMRQTLESRNMLESRDSQDKTGRWRQFDTNQRQRTEEIK